MKLSPTAIQLLKNDKQKFWGKHILKIKEDMDQSVFLPWRACHHWVYMYNKTTKKNILEGLTKLDEEIEKVWGVEDRQKMLWYVENGIRNYFDSWYPPHKNPEVYMETKYKDHYVVGYIDAIDDGQIIDYKFVSNFTKPDSKLFGHKLTKLEEYTIQALIYVFLAESKWFEIDQVRFIEILKKDTTIKPTTTIKKDKLINMIKENYKLDDEPTGTKPQLLEKYPLRWEAVKEIVFDVTDEFRKDIVKLLDESIEQIELLLP